jgi:hypothetical protein
MSFFYGASMAQFTFKETKDHKDNLGVQDNYQKEKYQQLKEKADRGEKLSLNDRLWMKAYSGTAMTALPDIEKTPTPENPTLLTDAREKPEKYNIMFKNGVPVIPIGKGPDEVFLPVAELTMLSPEDQKAFKRINKAGIDELVFSAQDQHRTLLSEPEEIDFFTLLFG